MTEYKKRAAVVTDREDTYDQLMSLTGEIKKDQIPAMKDIGCGFFKHEKQLYVLLKNVASGDEFVLPAEAVYELAQHFNTMTSQCTAEPRSHYYH